MSFKWIKAGVSIACVALSVLSASAKTPSHTITVTIKPGDTLSSVFRKLHLSYKTLMSINALPAAKSHLNHVHPGQSITFTIDKHHQLQHLVFQDTTSTLYVTAYGKHFKATVKNKPMKMKLSYRSVTIGDSAKKSALNAGIPTPMYAELTKIFQPNVNINLRARRGDHLSILYQEYYLNSKKNHSGDIVAAEFITPYHTYKAIRYSYPGSKPAYYTPNGDSLSAAFLPAPLHYTRISSLFTYHRLDPYTHREQPHLGVDYNAPEGTPVYSIGNGRIAFAGNKHGYGNAVIIAYGAQYQALYGHLEKFATNLYPGEAVSRGQVVGYLGHTGWATGPNLHFGIYVNGVAENPLTVKLPRATLIPPQYTHQYLAFARNMLDQLTIDQAPEFAENDVSRDRYKS